MSRNTVMTPGRNNDNGKTSRPRRSIPLFNSPKIRRSLAHGLEFTPVNDQFNDKLTRSSSLELEKQTPLLVSTLINHNNETCLHSTRNDYRTMTRKNCVKGRGSELLNYSSSSFHLLLLMSSTGENRWDQPLEWPMLLSLNITPIASNCPLKMYLQQTIFKDMRDYNS